MRGVLVPSEVTTAWGWEHAELSAGDPETDVFNRIVWTEPDGGSFYYCTVAFGLPTLEDALNSTETADASDPETMGSCGAFSWTKLSAP